MCQHLCVCLGHELIAFICQHLPKLDIVLDNAVMDHRDRPVRIKMGMCIDIVGHAMGCPSRMADAADTGHRLPSMGQILQDLQPSYGFGNIDLLTVIDCHTRRVIPAVL